MASNKNQTPEDENAIAQLNSQLTSAGERLANNKKIIYWVTGIILACGVLICGYLFIYRYPRLNKSAEAYNEVELKAQGNDSIAAAEYLKVGKKYGNTDSGKLAYLSAGESLYNLGKYKEAADCLEKFSSDDPVLDANAQVLLGDCYVNMKKYNEALGVYAKAISKADRNPQIVPRVLLKEVNIYEAQKKFDDAIQCLEEIKVDYPEFQLGNGMSMDAYIERLKARAGK